MYCRNVDFIHMTCTQLTYHNLQCQHFIRGNWAVFLSFFKGDSKVKRFMCAVLISHFFYYVLGGLKGIKQTLIQCHPERFVRPCEPLFCKWFG